MPYRILSSLVIAVLASLSLACPNKQKSSPDYARAIALRDLAFEEHSWLDALQKPICRDLDRALAGTKLLELDADALPRNPVRVVTRVRKLQVTAANRLYGVLVNSTPQDQCPSLLLTSDEDRDLNDPLTLVKHLTTILNSAERDPDRVKFAFTRDQVHPVALARLQQDVPRLKWWLRSEHPADAVQAHWRMSDLFMAGFDDHELGFSAEDIHIYNTMFPHSPRPHFLQFRRTPL